MDQERPLGISSRLARSPGRTRPWNAGNGQRFDLPVIVDYVVMDEQGLVLRIEATVTQHSAHPVIAALSLWARDGLDVDRLQREFRWRTPLDVVERLVPRMLAAGVDPFEQELPVAGFPEAALGLGRGRSELSDAFLREIAEEYLRLGRGYAKRMALERQVSPRTVVSWVVKARERGILGPPPKPGAVGGELRLT